MGWFLVLLKIKQMAQLVVNRNEVLLGWFHAHFDSKIAVPAQVVRFRMTDNVAVTWPHEERALPKRRRKLGEAE